MRWQCMLLHLSAIRNQLLFFALSLTLWILAIQVIVGSHFDYYDEYKPDLEICSHLFHVEYEQDFSRMQSSIKEAVNDLLSLAYFFRLLLFCLNFFNYFLFVIKAYAFFKQLFIFFFFVLLKVGDTSKYIFYCYNIW